ncbi:MAG TPA: peptidyl-prolyl cis-trans isomerase [Bryobacteraceae bacterium]|nr:peptidyl-prolyl cis-trans isomerase [Bryobacteraceae bacterium]
MFDLFRSRAKAVRILLGAMLGMVALSMLLYLIPGAGTTTAADQNDQVVAEIGKDVLTLHDVELGIQSQLRSQQIPPDLVQVIIPQQVDQMVEERAIAYQAKRLGFDISDQDLATAIRSTQFGTLNAQQYKDAIEQMGESVGQFENNMRSGLALLALESLAIEGGVVSPVEVEAEYKRRNDKIKLEYLGFDPTVLAGTIKPTPEQLKAYYDKNKNFFTQPETRDVQLIVADQAQIGQAIQISDSQVESYYNSHKDQYRTPERVQARHILIKTTGKTQAEVPQLKAKAEDLLKQIKGGADFAALAQKNSEDPGSAAKGGDLGWIVRGQMVKNFEDSVFSLKPKDVSDVITTEYGFHIIQVMAKEPARLRTLEEVKPEIVGNLRNQQVFDLMQNMADQAHAELVKAPQNARQIADKLRLQFVQVDKFKQGDTVPTLGVDPQAAAALMTLKKGEISQVIQAGNKLVVAEVTDLHAAHPAEFGEAELQVRTQYAQQQGMQLATEKAKKAADLLKTNGGDLKAAAKALGMEAKTTDFFARNGAAEGIGAASYLADGFDKPVGTIIGPINAGSQTVVAKIADRQQADMTKFAQERDALVLSLKGKRASERQIMLRDSILSTLIQQGKVKMHRDVINRLIARYRS